MITESTRFIEQLGFKEGETVRPTKSYNKIMSRSFVVGRILFIDKSSALLYIDSPVEGRMWVSASWCVPVESSGLDPKGDKEVE